MRDTQEQEMFFLAESESYIAPTTPRTRRAGRIHHPARFTLVNYAHGSSRVGQFKALSHTTPLDNICSSSSSASKPSDQVSLEGGRSFVRSMTRHQA
jgi:hypothetical protein